MSVHHTNLTCRKCVEWAMEMQRITRATIGVAGNLSIGITTKGILIQCSIHGQIAHITPAILEVIINQEPHCDLCERGETHQDF